MKTYYTNKPIEEGYTKEEDNTLDNMLEACDYMVSILDESKARQRYVANRDRDAAKAKKEYRYRADVYKEFPTPANKEKARAADSRYMKNHSEAEEYRNTDKTKDDHEDQDDLWGSNMNQENENDFRTKFHIPMGSDREDQSRIGQRKPGAVKRLQDQKRALKEACLYILSRLDDIDE